MGAYRKTQTFTTTEDFQTEVDVDIYEVCGLKLLVYKALSY
jgi:hypothetical protein